MEESSPTLKAHSRKRKIYSQSPFPTGVLTRSKSHNFSRSLADPISRKPVRYRPGPEHQEKNLEVNFENVSRIFCIKDLRMRRVFTPVVDSIPEEVNDESSLDVGLAMGPDLALDPPSGSPEPDMSINSDELSDLNLMNGSISGNGSISQRKTVVDLCKRRKVFHSPKSFSYKRLLPYLMDVMNDDSGISKLEISDPGLSYKKQKSGVKYEFRSVPENCTPIVKNVESHSRLRKPLENEFGQKIHKHDFNVVDNGHGMENIRQLRVKEESRGHGVSEIDFSVEEECGQMTPPDPDIFVKMDNDGGRETLGSKNELNKNQIYEFCSVGSKKSDRRSLKESKQGTILEVLNPCSRLRVFRNPHSVSYKRLLPFLMNMVKDNSGPTRINQQPKPQLDCKEDINSLSTSAAEQNNVKEIIAETCENQHTKDQDNNVLCTVFSPCDGSLPDSGCNPSWLNPIPSAKSSSNIDHNSLISENTSATCTEFNLQKQGTSKSQSSFPGSSLKTEPEFPHNDSVSFNRKEHNLALPPSAPVKNVSIENCTSEVFGSTTKQNQCFDVVEVRNKNAKSVKKDNNTLMIEVSDAMVTPKDGPLKGILKRNPRGCRGPCNCLNCASFRLHADRAFEFSCNQMHDAEEIASDLMKELTTLRLMLEKSVVHDNDLPVIQLNSVQVREACKKAMETENLAKARLSQLNYDLNVHCRMPGLQPPQVTFASGIQEKAIPVLERCTME